MVADTTDVSTNTQGDHEWRWSRQGVEQRIAAMSPSDAFLTVELFNARRANDVSKHLNSGACLSGLSPGEAQDIRARTAALRQSATGWGEKYWAERLREACTGSKDSSHDEAIMKQMAIVHPGFSAESLEAIYLFGIMLAR